MSVVEDPHYSEELAEIITTAMDNKGLTIKDLSKKLEVTYEHGRRLTKGFPPSKPMLCSLAKLLELDFDQLEEIAVKANIRRKFGDITLTMEGKNPEIEPIERNWKHLNEDQKEDVIALVKNMARRNRGGK